MKTKMFKWFFHANPNCFTLKTEGEEFNTKSPIRFTHEKRLETEPPPYNTHIANKIQKIFAERVLALTIREGKAIKDVYFDINGVTLTLSNTVEIEEVGIQIEKILSELNKEAVFENSPVEREKA